MRRVSQLLGKRWPWITMALLVVLAYFATLLDVRVAARDGRPNGSAADIEALRQRADVNVLFILIDTLRADRLGAWGYERDTSPTLDRQASHGVRFARQIAQSSWTKCSMASLWTGLDPARSGVTRHEHVLSPEARLPAEILREAGFRTAGLYRNGWVQTNFGFAQGFEVYTMPTARRPPASVRRENPTLLDAGTDFDALRAASEFLHIYGKERWFLYLHLMDVHEYLYDEDSALFGTAYSDVYDNAIRREDSVIDELFQQLALDGQLDRTLVVIASDHGEAFNERGYEGHARYVYRESTHVPLILSFPFRLETGVVVEGLSRNVDIWPTVLDLLGLPEMEGVDGRSQRPAILAAARGEPAASSDEPAYAHLDRTWGRRGVPPAPTVAIVDGSYRYVRTPRADGGHVDELFDVERDPAELEDVAAQQGEITERMSAMADRYLEGESPWQGETPTLEMDEMQLNQLRALGYAVP